MTGLTIAAAEAIEDAHWPATLGAGSGRWGAGPYPCGLFLELLFASITYLGGPGRFADLGAGCGSKVLLAADRDCPAWGVEIDPGLAAAARSLGADVATGRAEDADLDGTMIVYLNQLYQAKGQQAWLEGQVRERMDPGAVLISANYATPTTGWHTVWHDPGRWRGVWVKPS